MTYVLPFSLPFKFAVVLLVPFKHSSPHIVQNAEPHVRFERTWLDQSVSVVLAECCFTPTETVGLLGTAAQDDHLDFHTAPELCLMVYTKGITTIGTRRQSASCRDDRFNVKLYVHNVFFVCVCRFFKSVCVCVSVCAFGFPSRYCKVSISTCKTRFSWRRS